MNSVQGAAEELSDWLNIVEDAYGVRPVIYTTEAFYRECIAGRFADYDIWIRSVYKKPSQDVKWTFWQYSNRSRLKGYKGEEKYIDMNTFCGDAEAFAEYGRQ